ncbi:hypothetical protein [Neobacillus thermocopriae]|uniref:Cbb3-type cytochrome c oxidase subunit I n=1 Tax=Neobacillus thermocopriae TaxID=1215031 RepID=A0A6B3TQT1_9BACI|nr:hypothetical protein [Neobacillus thermocopriae]MED3625040.1 hypothetical protein [Neobacillus thermocopriae]MED3712762.1 hypothetical protein [Neobacillus thermocopriae]NEX79002.1 hypothetical protein [Neobacillus thermocopriae]
MFPQNLGSETNIKLPFSFILFSLAALVFSQFMLLIDGQLIANGSFRIPPIWSVAHLLILGWALMVAMGAMYQLVPVAFLTKIWNEKFGFIQFFVTAAGITSFSSMLYLSPHYAMIPGILTLVGILMFLFQMMMTLKTQKSPNILTAFVGSALICLLLTIGLGLTLLYMMNAGTGSEYYTSIFKSHLLLGLAGWFTLLIFGFSYKMVPMFSLSHGYPMTQARYVYGMYITGLLITLISFFNGQYFLFITGFLLLFIGFSTFSWHISIIIKKRMKKKLDKPFLFALVAIGFGNLIHLTALILLLIRQFENLAGPIIYTYILLWIVLSIVGYLYKIVPFLWWTHKYSKDIGKTKVPTLKEMMNEKIISPILFLFIVNVFIVFFAIIFKQTIFFTIGQFLLSITFIIFAISIVNVLRK